MRKQIKYSKPTNAKEIEKNYSYQWQTFAPFVEKYPNACLQMDGVLHPDIWEKQELKIMTFLKDSYRKDFEEHICTYILSALPTKTKLGATWRNVLKWINAVRNAFGKNKVINLQSIAHINVSKLACNGNISKNTPKGALSDAIEQDYALLYEQYKQINPNIVICGSTYHYFFDMLRREELSKQGKSAKDKFSIKTVNAYIREKVKIGEVKEIFVGKIGDKKPLYLYQVGQTLVFCAYHPSNYGEYVTKADHFNFIIENYLKT